MDLPGSPDFDARPIGSPALPTRAYSPGQVAGAAFLGSPIAGSWLLASNYILFGQPSKRGPAIFWGVAITFAVFTLALFLPEDSPNALVPGVYTLAYQQFAKRTQGELFDSYCSAGGRKHSHWRVFGIGTVFLIVVIGLMIAILSALPEGLLPAE